MEEIVSIIIPCYNHGHFIYEAIASVEECDPLTYELIIVNDGSTDLHTINVMQELSAKGYHVVNQKNQGLGATRNNGIKLAKGKYILPLDADNKIRKEYISYPLNYFPKHDDVDVIYGDVEYFGDKKGTMHVPDFNLQKMMLMNYIDACAVFRKSTWEKLGGYDQNMPFMGVEDWEFWLRIAFNGGKFHHANQIMFDYRVAQKSMLSKDTGPNIIALKEYMQHKHNLFLNYDEITNFINDKFRSNPVVFIGKFMLRTYWLNMYNRLIEKKIIRKI